MTIDLDRIVAIDVHTHAEVSRRARTGSRRPSAGSERTRAQT